MIGDTLLVATLAPTHGLTSRHFVLVGLSALVGAGLHALWTRRHIAAIDAEWGAYLAEVEADRDHHHAAHERLLAERQAGRHLRAVSS